MTLRVVHAIDSLSTGGAEKLLVTYAQQAAAHGVPATIMALRDKPGAILPHQLADAGAHIDYLPGKGLADLRRSLRLARWLRAERADVLHCHLEYSTILGATAAKLTGVPLVVTLHNTQQDRWAAIENFVLRHRARCVIAVGRTVAEAYAPRLHGRQTVILQNPVETQPPLSAGEREALRAALVGDTRRPILISVGRLSPQKGYSDLLEAMALLRATHPEAFLIVAGTGRLREQLEAQVRDCNLGSNMRLLGVREDIPQLLRAADVYVNASLWEGLPVSVLEAMAAGLPVAATAVGEVSGILEDGRGVLVPPRQPAELARAIGSLLEDPERGRQLGEAARQYVEKHHRADVWFDELFRIYAEVAMQRGA